MKKVSVEYCHYDGSQDLRLVLEQSQQTELPMISSIFPNGQRSIMFDDIHGDIAVDEFIEAASTMGLKPHIIYNESIFHDYVSEMMDHLLEKGFSKEEKGGKMWLVQSEPHYGLHKKFLLRFEKKGETSFSCPALVAASYLCRLGFFGNINLPSIWGERVQTDSDLLATFLPAKYINVEANVRDLMLLMDKKLANRVTWILS